MARITNEQIENRVKQIELFMKEFDLLEGEENLTAPYDSMKTPHLILQYGSPTYGNSWRIFATGGTAYGSGHSDPLHLTLGYLGSTRAEAWQTLTGIYTALSALSWQKQRKAYSEAEKANA